jgi:hypothetical protein
VKYKENLGRAVTRRCKLGKSLTKLHYALYNMQESCSYVPQPEQSIGQMPNKTRTWDRPSSPVNPTEKYTRNQTFLLHQGFDPVLVEKVLEKFGQCLLFIGAVVCSLFL